MAEDLVRARIQKLIDVWSDMSKYACECPHNKGIHRLGCCTLNTDPTNVPKEPCPCLDGENYDVECCSNNFLPSHLQELFDEISPEEVVGRIVAEIDPYLQRIFTEPQNLAFKKYNSNWGEWNWTDTSFAESATMVSGLFMSTEPIMKYDMSEVGYPFRMERTMWHTCNGLLRQASFRASSIQSSSAERKSQMKICVCR